MTREFTDKEVNAAWEKCGHKCECCEKALVKKNRGRAKKGRGKWEVHWPDSKRDVIVILCVGGVQNCHLKCGHKGNYHNPGVKPRKKPYEQHH